MERFFRLAAITAQNPSFRPLLRCPACRREGVFDIVTAQDLVDQVNQLLFGSRKCPNHKCNLHVFVVLKGAEVVLSYPMEVIDFDASRIPANIVGALEEAITCHANECYTAAAMMVRKTLEELCDDQKASGDTLFDRIEVLRKVVILPAPLMDGLHDIRLLGNDAAHIEARVYREIGKDEVEVAIDFTKELLKAVFQLGSLRERLAKLKKPES